eukprot:scaffold1931_cov77-Cylindrotheca_fusiformis.AAC.2
MWQELKHLRLCYRCACSLQRSAYYRECRRQQTKLTGWKRTPVVDLLTSRLEKVDIAHHGVGHAGRPKTAAEELSSLLPYLGAFVNNGCFL